MYLKNKNTEIKNVIRKHWSNAVIFTDAWRPGINEQELTEAELLPGELSAVIFIVGCYSIRSAKRVYRISESDCSSELEIPADKADIELVRKEVERKNTRSLEGYSVTVGMSRSYPSWVDRLCIMHEISAKHNASPHNMFIDVCRVTQSMNADWCEYIGDIYTVKENDSIPDEYASLLVYSHYEGSSFGADTWHKLDPTGKITKLELHPFDSKQDDARFV